MAGVIPLHQDGEPPHFQRPDVLYRFLQPVVAQADLKRKLAAAFAQYTRYLDDPSVGRPVVLVYGPSGTGKTFAVRTLAQACGLPFSEFSAASMAVQSYKGLTVRDLVSKHWIEHKTDTGIIFIDEIDKRCAGAIGADNELRTTGLAIQSELLRTIESEEMVFIDEDDPEVLHGVVIQTRQLFWVLAGAFTGLHTVIKHRLHNPYLPDEDVWKEAVENDFIAYGMQPELIFRCQTRAWVKPLEHGEIVQILRDQAVPQWVALFQSIGCTLTIDPGALGRCADVAVHLKTGARGGMTYLRRSLEDVYLEAAQHALPAVTIDSVTVESGKLTL
jgi:ATP-dependent Clp protease ATP-binding subunit ClpX